MLFVGNDWSVGHHDVCLTNETGEWLAARRLGEGPEGMGQFHEMVSEWVDDPSQVVGGRRNRPRIVDRGAGGGGLSGVCDQPPLGGPVPGTTQRVGCQV